MASLLEGALKRTVAAKFHGKLKSGTIRREALTTTDSGGNAVPGTPTLYTFEGIRENFDTLYYIQGGISDNDVKIMVLNGSIKPSEIMISTSDRILIGGVWHQILRVLEVDPAGATTVLQCTEVAPP